MKLIFIIKHNEHLAEHTIKMGLINYCSNISMQTLIANTANSKTNEPQKFVFNLSQRLHL